MGIYLGGILLGEKVIRWSFDGMEEVMLDTWILVPKFLLLQEPYTTLKTVPHTENLRDRINASRTIYY